MLNKKVLEYVDDVMTRVSASDAYKAKLENKLIKEIILFVECRSAEDIEKKFGSPKECAAQLNSDAACELALTDKQIENEPEDSCSHARGHGRYMPPRSYGEYTREESNINLKLLYIPLIQISSGTERIRLPVVGEYYY